MDPGQQKIVEISTPSLHQESVRDAYKAAAKAAAKEVFGPYRIEVWRRRGAETAHAFHYYAEALHGEEIVGRIEGVGQT